MRLAVVAEGYLAALATRGRPRTVKESAAILSRIVAELGVETVEELSRGRIRTWREERLRGGASNKTVNNQLAVLLAALADAVECELIESHPLAGLRSLPVGPRHQRRKPRALADFEVTKLLAALADMDANPPPEQRPRIPQELLARVLLETGARWGELTAATWADVDTAAGTLTLRAETTKTEAERCIPLRRETCERLVAYRLECAAVTGTMPAAGDPIFLSPKGRPWTSGSNFRKVLGAAYERAGLLERDERGRLKSRDGHALHVHTLRHTCCTRLLAAGVPVPIVQALLGHASPQMTLRVYSHLRAEAVRPYLDAVALTAGSSKAALRVSVT
jgi:integrase